MNKKTLLTLNKLNKDFYKITATDFDSSRQYFWQGWKNLIKYLKHFNQLKLIDLGCGNARFYQFIKETLPKKDLEYFGIDNSEKLLEFAKNNYGSDHKFNLQKIDIVSSLIEKVDFIKQNDYDVVASFGVFHHIPSFDLRLELLRYLKTKIKNNGLIIISFWQFMNYERFRKKVIPSKLHLENNDYILDWNRGEKAIRYCHWTNDEEQNRLVKESGLNIIEKFKADGKEKDGNTYLVLKK